MMFSSDEHKDLPPDYEATVTNGYSAAQQQQQQQAPPLPTPPPAAQFACLSISQYDRIRLVGFSAAHVAAVHAVVRDAWAKGLDSVQSTAGAQEIKLKGTPWIPNLKGDDEARGLLLSVVAKLYAMGWVTCASVTFTLRLAVDKGSLFFRALPQPPPPAHFILVSFDHLNKLKIIGDVPPGLGDDLVQTLGTRVSSQEVSADRVKIKMYGNTWLAAGEDAVRSQFLVMSVLKVLDRFGFRVYTALETQNGHSGYEMDSLICLRER